ncbi:GNAT family N-acetyltransferase [Litorilituus sediminis]|uniref:GNAT family N-acetyltransferase n=1 Tax=Litorilituus sediminis TaxID=718192 RepID=A0A4P6P1B6_9GAMM|nr:GNAT family N-acetyltransferase [Litorilituus sediminis]QBG34734.1 GNAT family N-acetyltransferase [Litorilituus sediminis]
MLAIRSFKVSDKDKLADLAVLAFQEYQQAYEDWPALVKRLRCFAELASSADIFVATIANEIVGAVAYVGAQSEKADYFPDNTPIIRMLVVAPKARGQGIGMKLTQACIDKARSGKNKQIALHTSSIMKSALTMYLAMGFEKTADAPTLLGVDYGVYVKRLGNDD